MAKLTRQHKVKVGFTVVFTGLALYYCFYTFLSQDGTLPGVGIIRIRGDGCCSMAIGSPLFPAPSSRVFAGNVSVLRSRLRGAYRRCAARGVSLFRVDGSYLASRFSCVLCI